MTDSTGREKTLAEAAQTYRDNHHWVSLRLKGKLPDMDKRWQERTLTDEIPRFGDADNIGVLLGEPSGGLVRLDPDFPGVPALTEILFPEPTMTFGRSSSPRSGRLLSCPGMKTRNFGLPKSMKGDARLPMHDGKPNLIVYQILSTGAQSMVPPSLHPETHEAIVWESSATLAAIDPAELLWRVGLEAFLMTVRYFWPARGVRNEAAMALARVLLETLEAHGLDDETKRIDVVDELVLIVAMEGGDGAASRNGKERAAATLAKMKAGQDTIGLTRLVELLELPQDLVKIFRRWLDLSATSGRPVIKIFPGKPAQAVEEAEAALIAAGVPIFVRGGMLVEPITTSRIDADEQPTTATVFVPLTINRLRYLLNKYAATFMGFDRRKSEWVEISPPATLLADLHALQTWKFPQIGGIVTAPTLRPDGTVLAKPGYDTQTRLWCASNIVLPEIPEAPTKEQALVALKRLEDLLVGFKFVGDVDKAVALAAFLTVVVRGAFDYVPFFLITAHVPGEGKSYLVDLCACIVSGRNCPVIGANKNAEEMEKRLGALLLEGAALTSLDNISFDIQSDLLCKIATQQFIKIRILGKSEQPECEWRGTLFGTGNNVRILGDMTRRTLRLQLDAKVERPELRNFQFDPRAEILANRGVYVAAAITIARAYIVAGKPEIEGAHPLASYERWSRVVRLPLMWLGVADPVGSMDALRQEDPELTATEELLTQWSQHLGTSVAFTAGDVIKKATAKWPEGGEFQCPDFRTLLIERCGVKGEPDPTRLGKWLRKIHGRIYGGKRIDIDAAPGRTNRYRLHDNATPDAVV